MQCSLLSCDPPYGSYLNQALGLGIIAGAAFVKVPQITTLTSSKSAEGLSALGFELENIGLTIHAAYGFLKQLPFGTYGEATIMLLQNTVLLALVYKYAKVPTSRVFTMAATNLLIIAAVLTGERLNMLLSRLRPSVDEQHQLSFSSGFAMHLHPS